MFISKVCETGDGVSADLALDAEAVNNTPLDEGPGEGWHRASSQTLSKASASQQPWLMGSVREEQSIKLLTDFIRNNGERGRKVFRLEWQNFKRVLQPGKRHEFVPRRLNDRGFFRSLYRLDGHDPWNGFLAGHRQPPNPNDGRDDPSSQTKCKYEYLEKLITVTKYYSVPVTKRQLDGDGVMQTTTKKSFFQILNVFNAHSRPKLVPAWDDAENVVKQYGMSVTAHHLAMSESIMEAFP